MSNGQSPHPKYLIEIDSVTSNDKTPIINQNDQVVTWAVEKYGINSPQTDWVEQDL